MNGLRDVRVRVEVPRNGFDESEHAEELMRDLMVGTRAKVRIDINDV